MGLPVICIDARHAKAALKMQINKSDRNDAVGIARIMQCAWYKEVRIKDLDSHAIKALLVSRALLVKITIPGTVGYFQSIGYPGFFAYLVIMAEIGGGLALILGVWTRAIAVLLLPIMIGATLQHVGHGWVFNATGGGWEFPVFWIVALLVQALLGDGAYALRIGRSRNAASRLASAYSQ